MERKQRHYNSLPTQISAQYNMQCFDNVGLSLTKFWAIAHKTRERLWQFLFAGNLSLSSFISSQFTLLQRKIAKKITQNQYLWRSRSFKVINVDISKKQVVSPCSDMQHVCAYLQPFTR